jgi:hypothetical protein
MSDTTLQAARARYLDDVRRVHPQFDDQVCEVILLLRWLLGEDRLPVDSPLHAARADYLARLRDRYRTLDEQVLELARAGKHLFGPAVGVNPAG